MQEKDPVMKTLEGTQDATKMLSLVSHKLKTPLSIINGYSEAILSQSSKEKFSPFTAKALEEINKQGTKLCSLVDKLLFFNKVENSSSIIETLKETKSKIYKNNNNHIKKKRNENSNSFHHFIFKRLIQKILL